MCVCVCGESGDCAGISCGCFTYWLLVAMLLDMSYMPVDPFNLTSSHIILSLSPSSRLSPPLPPLLLSLPSLFSYIAQTSPADVARVEKQTFVCTERKEDAVPEPRAGVESALGNWKAPAVMDKELDEKFPGCMKGGLHSWQQCWGWRGSCV